jgi:hypothetical protein
LPKENPSSKREVWSFFLSLRTKRNYLCPSIQRNGGNEGEALCSPVDVQKAAAADAPAPGPTSDAAIFVPTFLASLAALAFGMFF